ncbi:MAG: DUF354 domain-containing protein [Candidatus Bathyarchaeota archaeon]
MKIIVDILHPADINFYKNALRILKTDYGVNYELIVLPRSSVVPIIQQEYPENNFICIGNYRYSLAGKILCLIQRTILIMKYLRHIDFDIVTSFGSYGIAQAAYLLNKPSVIFHDDVEYKLSFDSFKNFASRIVLTSQNTIIGKNIVKYDGFKELAYLHPNYFTPNDDVLLEYGLEPLNYVLIREVSNSSFNYRNLIQGQLVDVCHHLRKMGLEVVLSLENKALKDKFEGKCILLKEPVSDVHSLLHFALLTITSGDTMARESCLVGTPSIYTGGRKMSVNKVLEDKSCLFNIEANNTERIFDKVKDIIENNVKKKTGKKIKEAIKIEWEDTTKVIIDNLLGII